VSASQLCGGRARSVRTTICRATGTVSSRRRF
jgi:hypothetical protein